MKRNAAVVPGNAGTADDVPVLEQALADPEPLVRQHAAWALAQIDGSRIGAAPRPGPDPRGAELGGAPTNATVIPEPVPAT